MIQLNLLPDVKMDYIKAQRQRRLVFSVSALVTVAAIVGFSLLMSYNFLQKKHIHDLNKDIASESQELRNKPNIDKILTVQNQLESLTSLHTAKPAVKNLFSYLNVLTPTQVSISAASVDFNQHSVNLTGTTDSLASVNKYVDTLKFTTYTEDGQQKQQAFSSVVLGSFSLNTTGGSGSKAASYNVTFTYEPDIFDNTKNIKLTVPNLITTRAAADHPTDLFQAPLTTPAKETKQ